MPNLNIALTEDQHARLQKYKETRKPHLSMRAIIVEAVERALEGDRFAIDSSQLDVDALSRPEILERLR